MSRDRLIKVAWGENPPATVGPARDNSEGRRYYELTPNGRAVALDEIRRLQAMMHRVAAHLPGTAS